MDRQQEIKNELERMVRLISEEPSVRRVILFGSNASGEAVGEWSDIDLCIVQESNLRFYDRLAWWLRKLRPAIGIDLVVYTPVEIEQLRAQGGFYTDEIEAKGKDLYAA
jgi:uncharacterized protein